MTSQGHAYARFRRALASRSLLAVRAAAAELPQLSLRDALAVAALIREREPQHFSRAAARWAGRLALERQIGLDELADAVAALRHLPAAPARALLERVADHPPAR